MSAHMNSKCPEPLRGRNEDKAGTTVEGEHHTIDALDAEFPTIDSLDAAFPTLDDLERERS